MSDTSPKASILLLTFAAKLQVHLLGHGFLRQVALPEEQNMDGRFTSILIYKVMHHNGSITFMIKFPINQKFTCLGNFRLVIQCVAIKNIPLNKYHYFQYISIFFYEIFRDYSGHNLTLLVRISSSELLLFRSSTSLNIRDNFFNCTDK